MFLPGLPDAQPLASARPGVRALGLSEPFAARQSYGAWWWGISRSALRGMLVASGFEVVQEHGDSLHATLVANVAT